MNYSDWLKSIPETLSADPLWRVTAYRLALFCADVAWRDVTKLMKDKRTVELADEEPVPYHSGNDETSELDPSEFEPLLNNVPLS